MVTPRQFAQKHEVAYTTVIAWLNKSLLVGAKKEDLAYGGFMWLIPENAAPPDLKPGPKPKTEADEQSGETEEEPKRAGKKAK